MFSKPYIKTSPYVYNEIARAKIGSTLFLNTPKDDPESRIKFFKHLIIGRYQYKKYVKGRRLSGVASRNAKQNKSTNVFVDWNICV